MSSFTILPVSGSELAHFRLFMKDEEFRKAKSDGNICLGAYKFSCPAGYIRITKEPDCISVGYIFVAEVYRRKGLGRDLLEYVTKLYADEHTENMKIKYFRNEYEDRKSLEYFLENTGWSEPEVLERICITDRRILRAPWIRRAKIPDGFKVYLWHTTDASLREFLKNDPEREDWEKDNLSPFNEQSRDYIPQLSFCIVKDDYIIGWLITTEARPGIARYGNLYIRREYRGLGLSFALLSKAFAIQDKELPEYPEGIWKYSTRNTERVNFNTRRMAPYVKEIHHHLQRTKPV